MKLRPILTHGAAVALGAACALWLRPTPEVRERVRTETVEVAMEREEWVTRRELHAEEHQVREEHHGPVRITRPDGTVEERAPVVVRVETGTTTADTTDTAGMREVERIVREVVEVERVVQVDARPDWLLAAQVGAGSTGLMYGGQVSRRVLGPIYLQAGGLVGGGEWVGTAGFGVGF